MNQIRHDKDGFLVPKQENNKIDKILINTEELLNKKGNKKPRQLVVNVKSPRQVKSSSAIKKTPPIVNRITPIQKREQADRAIAMRQAKIQTELLGTIAKNGKSNRSGLIGLLGLGAGVLKGLTKLPFNLMKGMMGGGKLTARGANGQFLPKGAKGVGLLGKIGKFTKGVAKGGALAALFGLLDGLSIENSDGSRADKNKAHAKNFAIGAGGVGGAMIGATLGSVVPVVGTIIGGILGGFGGAALMEHWVDWLDSRIDPRFSQQLFGSWKGFTGSLKTMWQGLTGRAEINFGEFTQLAKNGWLLFTDGLSAASMAVWNELIPNSFKAYFVDLGTWSKDAWASVVNSASKFWDSLKSVAGAAFDTAKSVGDSVAKAWNESSVGKVVNQAVSNSVDKAKEISSTVKQSTLSILGYDMTKKYQDTAYVFGGKNIAKGIDCSNWTFQIQKMETTELNRMLGFNKYSEPKYRVAAEQISYYAALNGVVTDQREKGGIDFSKIKAGMLIGQHKHSNKYQGYGEVNVKGYGKTRYNHVAKVVRGKDGKLYVSESQGGSKTNQGVTLTPLKKWFGWRQKRGDNLTVVNPFGSDIGLLNGEIGAVAKNEVSKVYTGAVDWTSKSMEKVGKYAASKLNLHNQKIVAEEAQKAGVDPAIALAMAHIETGGKFNADAWNKWGYAGLFQFSRDNRQGALGQKYGLNESNKFDARANSRAGMIMLNENRAAFIKKFGREPSAGELYLMHQRGQSGAFALLENRDKNVLAVKHTSVKNVTRNGGNVNMTAGQFADMWIKKGNAMAATYGGVKPVNMSSSKVAPSATSAKPKITTPLPATVHAANTAKSVGNMIGSALSASSMAHKPVSRTVSNKQIAHMASGGIMDNQN